MVLLTYFFIISILIFDLLERPEGSRGRFGQRKAGFRFTDRLTLEQDSQDKVIQEEATLPGLQASFAPQTRFLKPMSLLPHPVFSVITEGMGNHTSLGTRASLQARGYSPTLQPTLAQSVFPPGCDQNGSRSFLLLPHFLPFQPLWGLQFPCQSANGGRQRHLFIS